jgi:hypothetical protein
MSHQDRVETLLTTQKDISSRANSLLRKIQSAPYTSPSEAELRWFKELERVHNRITRGLLVDSAARVAEARRYVDVSKRRGKAAEEGGKDGVDWRVVETVEEMYFGLVAGGTNLF